MAKEIAVISGKGGTGKTSLVGSLAILAKSKIMVDCDVDAADLHLILGGDKRFTEDFVGRQKAKINYDLCDQCGICYEFCRFDAINEVSDQTGHFVIDDLHCEGCGVCVEFCPNNAIDMIDHVSGQWYESNTEYGLMVHAKLGIAEANSGRLVSLLRNRAKEMAKELDKDYIIVDGSPGIGCPVIASLTGIDYALIVTEPTVSAIHDMERLLELIRHFGIKTGLCINKHDINNKLTEQVERFAKTNNISIVARLPYDENVTKAQIAGIPYLKYVKDEKIKQTFYDLWEIIESEIKSDSANNFRINENLIQLNNNISSKEQQK